MTRASRRRLSTAGGLPPAMAPFAVLAMLFLLLPVVGLVVRAPWRTLPDELSSPEALEALRLSLVCATLATLVCLLLGVPLAWVLARTRVPGRSLLRALVTVPLVLPPVVGGVALFTALGRRGIVGQWLDEWFIGCGEPVGIGGIGGGQQTSLDSLHEELQPGHRHRSVRHALRCSCLHRADWCARRLHAHVARPAQERRQQ